MLMELRIRQHYLCDCVLPCFNHSATHSLSPLCRNTQMAETALNMKPSKDDSSTRSETIEKNQNEYQKDSYPGFYCPLTGIYSSKHPTVPLPGDPFLDVVSFIFSHSHNGQTALIDSSSESSILYKDLFPMVKSIASGLQTMGIKQGDVVLLLLPSSILYPVVFLSVLYVGAIVNAMNPLSSVTEIKKQVNELNPSIAFTNLETLGKLETFGFPVVCVPGDLSSNRECDEHEAFHKLVDSGNVGLFRKPVIRQEDTAAILYSSGTTGASKGVVLTHRNFISMVELFVRFEASMYTEWPSSKNVYLAVVPMFHIYGIAYFVMGLLSLGTCVVVMRKFDPDEAVKLMDKFGVTHFSVVPPVLTALTKSAKGASGNPLKSLKQVCCGAAPIPAKAIQEFVEAFPHVDFIQGYGMTESPGVGARGFNTKKFKKYSSMGLMIPNGQAKVVDCVIGSFLPPGCVGELCLRGTGIMKGYLNNKEATAQAIDKDGWLHTGDIGYIDHDGYMYIIDRLKDTIKYKGFQIAPADLEGILISHPEVLDAAVIGASDEECGEIPVAFVVRKPGSSLSEAAVINYVAAQVTPYKKVRKVVFTQSIPRSAAGKILRRELKNLLNSRL